jgi:hypothetical protein
MQRYHPPHRRLLAPLALAGGLILLSGGCGDDRAEAELASELYARPLKVEVQRQVDAGALPSAHQSIEVGRAKRVFSIGARDGDERYLFGRIAGVALSGSGDVVFVLDQMERQVKAFTRDGRFLYRFGGRGKGPGEFEDPNAITATPWNDGVAVWDSALQRVTILASDGRVLHTAEPLRQSDIARQGKRLRASARGFVLETRSDPYTTRPELQRGYLVRLDTLGQPRDTLADYAIPPVEGSTVQGNAGLVSTMALTAPTFTPEPRWALAPDGEVAFVPGGRYAIFRLTDGEHARLKVTRPWTPGRVRRRERVLNIQAAQDRGEFSRRVPVFVLELAQRRSFARVRPALAGVLVDERGRMWAQRFDAIEDPGGRSRTWDAYAPDGAPAGSVRFAAGFVPLVVRGGLVYGTRRDELDVDRLEAYRL